MVRGETGWPQAPWQAISSLDPAGIKGERARPVPARWGWPLVDALTDAKGIRYGKDIMDGLVRCWAWALWLLGSGGPAGEVEVLWLMGLGVLLLG